MHGARVLISDPQENVLNQSDLGTGPECTRLGDPAGAGCLPAKAKNGKGIWKIGLLYLVSEWLVKLSYGLTGFTVWLFWEREWA